MENQDLSLVATAIRKGIPPGRYREIKTKLNASSFNRTEAAKALKYIFESNFDKDTLDLTLEMFVDKIVNAVTDRVTATLMEENWRVS